MNKYLLLFALLLTTCSAFSQLFLRDRDFTYGKMIAGKDTLVGYFHISKQFSSNGQNVTYRKKLGDDAYYDNFPSRKYEFFIADSLYMETFDAVPSLTGDIKMMVPRVLNGNIQVFALKINGGVNPLMNNKYVYLKRDGVKFRVSKKNFKEQISQVISDDKVLMSRIETGELDYKDVLQIATLYNEAHPVASTTK